MIKGAAFDGANVERADGAFEFSNLMSTQHFYNLEQDYKLLRREGYTFFRDNCDLSALSADDWAHWAYLDRLADLSYGEIQLTISHYEFPRENCFDFCKKLAKRYRKRFHSYVPVVEMGYWAVELGERKRWHPVQSNWWEAFKKISQLALEITQALKAGDPSCRIGSAEPWGFGAPWNDQARPYWTMLGQHDRVAAENGCYTHSRGHPGYLDIIGLNIYNENNIRESLYHAKRLFPGKEIIITETGRLGHPTMSNEDWWQHIAREAEGTGIETICWAPAITMLGFEDAQPLPGALYDIKRQKLN